VVVAVVVGVVARVEVEVGRTTVRVAVVVVVEEVVVVDAAEVRNVTCWKLCLFVYIRVYGTPRYLKQTKKRQKKNKTKQRGDASCIWLLCLVLFHFV
jgi:hypothetical protein